VGAQHLRADVLSLEKKYGDMDLADARRLKVLEKENTELKPTWAKAKRASRLEGIKAISC
jgi:hypothetical protein